MVARIKPMKPGLVYALKVQGKRERGTKEHFLRRRTAEEIIDSGLSSGCGDYAIAFERLVRDAGYEALFIDSARLSLSSLITAFEGHAVVAVRDKSMVEWFLVDPTARRIVSRTWRAKENIFLGEYWIGYQGPLSEYPVSSPEGLKIFYRKTLESVPPEVWNKHLVGLRFTVDQSLKSDGDGYLNPRIPRLLNYVAGIFGTRGIKPSRCVVVHLVKGSPDATSYMNHDNETGWTCRVGLKSSLGEGFVGWMAKRVGSPPPAPATQPARR